MANLTETNVTYVSKSITEGFNDFGKIEEVSDIPMKNSDGEPFTARGFKTTKCFIMFSKKLEDKFEGKSSIDILSSVLKDKSAYQFVSKPGATWKNGSPIWVLTTSGNTRIQQATATQVAQLNMLIG